MTLAGVLVLLAACFIGGLFAQTPCTTDGWFGLDCQYQCHCVNSAPCDKVDGSCSSGCHSDWFGPACQYNRATFRASGLGWLTDNSDTTCNTGSSTSVTVNLNTAIPLTWVRVVFNDAASLNQIELKINSPLQSCTELRTAKVNDVTLDIYCPTVTTVNQIILSGSGVTKLCALYISGGRNVALKQPAQQSSRYIPSNDQNYFLAGNAVDGRVGGNTRESTQSTCTHTGVDDSPDWWTVNFTWAVDVNRFLIYNRIDCCQDRLVGFTLMAHPESGSSVTLYTDIVNSQPQSSYSVVPSSKINFPVSRVQVDLEPNYSATKTNTAILTLCEVLVFGENRCPPNMFGLLCELQCNCASGGSCFVHSGGCPDGCATNYAGEDCYECAAGKYGANCDQDCSDHCGGDNSCDRDTGFCIQQCDPGYTGDKCPLECNPGFYGAGCSSVCSANCAGSNNDCHHVTGVCDIGCDPGYYGDDCGTICSAYCAGPSCDRNTGACSSCIAGRYGTDCLSQCGVNCGGSNNICNIFSGDCVGGCDPGYKGVKCDQICESGKYGDGCTESCSVHCAGEGDPCNHITGECDQDCDPGYYLKKCTQVCSVGFYGAGCKTRCSSNCAGSDNACHHVTGVCDSCPHGKYSSDCSFSCSANCAGSDNACDRDTGNCECDTGHWGHKCLNNCNEKCAGQDHACLRIGGACMSCSPGLYGTDCSSECSVTCGGLNNACNIINGDCVKNCDPGYREAKCNMECISGTYGKSCDESCSEHCAGNGTCHHVNGTCDSGCDPEYKGPKCTDALQQSGETGESGLKIWGISMTIVAAGAIIVIGLLVWRLFKCAKEQSSTSTNNGIVEEAIQRSGQQGILNINRPDQRYELAQVGPEDVNLYNEGFDHYDSPLDLMRRTGDYENLRPVGITDSNPDYVKADNVPSVGRNII